MLCVALPMLATAQNFTISGTLKDGTNGEDLIGATVILREKPNVGAASNTYGFYSLTVPAGSYTLVYQYIGYATQEMPITLDKDLTLNRELLPSDMMIKEVVIQAERRDQNVTNTDMSVTKLDMKEIESVPVLFGEKDVMKTIQMTPGVKSAGEGNAGFYVRGGAIDQNLILLDEAPVYNASHLLGFFSVFNSDALKDVTLYKGTQGAEYGGRGSSVMDIKMKEGNLKEYDVSGGIGLIASRVTIEGPIQKDEGSFIVSARRTYADLFLKLSTDENINSASLYFYDLNAKANYRLGSKDRLFISGYFGRDVLGLGDAIGFNWGNYTGTLRWNHIYNDKLFSNTSVIFSNYDYQFKVGFGDNGFKVTANIEDINLKQDYTWYPNSNNTVKFGVNAIRHSFLPTKLEAIEGSSFTDQETKEKYAIEGGLYIQNDQKIGNKWGLSYGLRYSLFDYIGPGVASTYNPDGSIATETTYSDWESIKTYGGLEPRLAVKYQIDGKSAVKASVTRNYQYLHLLSNATTSTPTDLWIPSSNNVKPQRVDQVSLGYFRNFADNKFEFSVEGYYKDLANQIDYKDGAELTFNDHVEAELTFGRGIAYGAEFYLRKRQGKLTGWVSYTLSRSLKQFDDINFGELFPARQDRIHDLAIVAMYDITPKWKVSANWIYYTGSAVTFPSGKYEIEGQTVPYYTERNGYRMPDYHRLDVGLTWQNKKTDRFESSWNLSVYNAYGRENAYSIAFQPDPDDPSKTQAERTALFKYVPSLTYNFKF